MSYLTGLILAAFVAYVLGWYQGYVEGNMALLLSVAVLVTGAYWLAERFWFLPRRKRAAEAFLQAYQEKQQVLQRQGVQGDAVDVQQAQARLLAQPWWLDWTAGLFPIILLVFVVRSFAYEPFRIPSGSMLPTLESGDLILVNKYTWGMRLPILKWKLTAGDAVARGDVMVFHYPPNPNIDYIKRVVGLPGDTVAYLNKKLTINGEAVTYEARPPYLGSQEEYDPATGQSMKGFAYFQESLERLGEQTHRVIVDEGRPAGVMGRPVFPGQDACQYVLEGVTCKVPAGHYFVMGDNRDHSADSRYWGFVPDANIVGKAVVIWMNFSDLGRVGRIE